MSKNDLIGIRRIIAECCGKGVLFPIDPLMLSDRIVRKLYVSKDINDLLQNPPNKEWFSAPALLEHFVTGGIISVPDGTQKYNKSRHQMALLRKEDNSLENEGIWEMRITKPRPGIRLLGMMVEQDFMILLTAKDRNDIVQTGWPAAIGEAKNNWASIFGQLQPLKGLEKHEYITDIFLN